MKPSLPVQPVGNTVPLSVGSFSLSSQLNPADSQTPPLSLTRALIGPVILQPGVRETERRI